MRRLRFALVAGLPCALLLFALACGGGSSSNNNNNNSSGGGGGSSAANQIPLAVTNFNSAYVSVTVCRPGTSTCVTVPNVEVDTGATGLRLLSGTVDLLGLTNVTTGGQTLANCVMYLDNSFQWGPVATVDVSLAGELASNVPMQIIAETNYAFPTAPSSCGGNPVNSVNALSGANGFIGLSFYQQDCGSACAPGTTSNAGSYYKCGSTTSSCVVTTVSLAQQLQNPVGLFANDNNGVVVALQPVPLGGAASAGGTLTFGIGTQANNALGGAVVLTPDNSGNFTTKFKNAPPSIGFIDSGSNGLFFLNTAETGIPECTSSPGFYCPASTESLTAINTGFNGATSTVSFSVANPETQNGNFEAFSNTAGPGDSSNILYFDWGLPFFYGRNVYVALENAAGTGGAYWAYDTF